MGTCRFIQVTQYRIPVYYSRIIRTLPLYCTPQYFAKFELEVQAEALNASSELLTIAVMAGPDSATKESTVLKFIPVGLILVRNCYHFVACHYSLGWAQGADLLHELEIAFFALQ